jgi:hypothetical protein
MPVTVFLLTENVKHEGLYVFGVFHSEGAAKDALATRDKTRYPINSPEIVEMPLDQMNYLA